MDFTYPVGENFQLGEWDGTTFKERFRVSGSVTGQRGNIGIGTTTPFAKLSVHVKNDDDYTEYLFAIASSTPTATTTHLVVTNDGNVGIGTATPAEK
ncbi:MAG: hypothetical protein Athens101410_243, partial [Parcubacteria group bacterium Athens1014_10]